MIEHKYNNIIYGCMRESVGMRNKEKKFRSESKITKNESFFLEFADEIDLFSLQELFPEWVYDYRESILNRVRKEFRVMCQYLKDAGIVFYIKYPIEIDGKWKFADVFIPDRQLVVLLINDKETIGLPWYSKTERETWFSDRYRTIGVFTYDVSRTLELVRKAI